MRILLYGLIILWGGGTEVYSERQIDVLRKTSDIIRVQYLLKKDRFAVCVVDGASCDFFILRSLLDIKRVLEEREFKELVVNNLVGYKDTLAVLDLLKFLCSTRGLHITFNLHDFQCICPNFNLMYKGKEFCELRQEKCQYCFSGLGSWLNRDLCSGARNLNLWRETWRDFFYSRCHEIVVFSNSSKEIFLKVYPKAASKILVRPHLVPYLRPAKVKAHDGLNVAFLGSICSEAKGSSIVRNLVLCNQSKDLRFFVIGEFSDPPEKLDVLGRYEIERLPDIIEEKEIDLIIIPSIWPETFSYTTSEAIQLNVPVACFNIGAQRDKVGVLKEKVIFFDNNPEIMLHEIMNFFSKKK